MYEKWSQKKQCKDRAFLKISCMNPVFFLYLPKISASIMLQYDTKSINVMYVLGSVSKIGGVERVITDKMNYLANIGCKVTLVTYEQGTHPIIYPLHPRVRHIDVGVRFFQLYKCSYPKRFFENIKWRRTYYQRLQKIVDEVRPSVISTVTYELEYCDILPKLKTSAKFIIESHCAKSYTKDFTDGRTGLKSFFSKVRMYMQFRKIANYDILVALTQGDADDWRRIATRVEVIPNPVTLYPDTVKEYHHSRRIIAVGRLHRQKGFDMLIDAFSLVQKKCPQWSVSIFGGGEDEKVLKQRILDAKMQDCIFINSPTQDIYSEYQNSDFLVLSSRYEGFGLVLIEAMSCGIPCVAFDCPYGPKDVIEDGYNGLLVDNENVESLAEKILWMCNNPEKCEAMGVVARKSASLYKIEQIMPRWLELYSE